MAQEAAPEGAQPAKGQEPEAPKEGQGPQGEPKGQPETFDREYVERIRSEAAQHRTRATAAEKKLQDQEDADKSEADKAKAKADRAETRAIEAEAKLLRYTVAAEKNVPTKLVPLLSASSKEELEAQADLILENAKAETPSPEFDGGPREPAPDPKSPERAHDELITALIGGRST